MSHLSDVEQLKQGKGSFGTRAPQELSLNENRCVLTFNSITSSVRETLPLFTVCCLLSEFSCKCLSTLFLSQPDSGKHLLS